MPSFVSESGLGLVATRIRQAVDVVIGVLLALIALSLIYQVFGRYVLHHAPSWTEEFSRLAIVWLVMLGAAGCLRTRSHIAIPALLDRASGRTRLVLVLLRDLCTLLCLLLMLWSGSLYAVLNYGQLSPAFEISMFWAYLAIPFGAFCAVLVLILRGVAEEYRRTGPKS